MPAAKCLRSLDSHLTNPRSMPRQGNDEGFVVVEFLMQGLSLGGILVVLAMIAVQSGMATSRASTTRAEAHMAAVKADLQNLSDRQAIHYADVAAFAASLSALQFQNTDGVAIELETSPSGWSGVATHEALGKSYGCTFYVGGVPVPTEPVRPAAPGEVACTQ